MNYSTVTPHAQYSPWLDDAEFMSVYELIKEHTLVDLYRCYELWQLLDQTKAIMGDVLEVGVWRGGTGALISSRVQRLSSGKTVYLCDTFAGIVKASTADSSYNGGEHADASAMAVEALLRECGARNARVLEGVFPEDTANNIPAEAVSFVHIDVDVYQSAKDVMNYVWPRMHVGAVAVFDDYGFASCDGITKLVNGYRSHPDKLVIHNLNGHAILVKTLF